MRLHAYWMALALFCAVPSVGMADCLDDVGTDEAESEEVAAAGPDEVTEGGAAVVAGIFGAIEGAVDCVEDSDDSSDDSSDDHTPHHHETHGDHEKKQKHEKKHESN